MTIGIKSRSIIAGLLVATVLLLAGCSASPPEDLTKVVDALPGQIEDAREAVDAAEGDFTAKLDTSDYGFMKSYTVEEQHADRFDQARTKLDDAESAYEKKVKPLIEDYEDSKKADLEAAVAEVAALKDDALELKDEPSLWADQVLATKTNPEGVVDTAASTMEFFNAAYATLTEDVEGYKKTYDFNAEAIEAKYTPLSTLNSDAVTANELLKEEAGKTSPNYAVMTTQALIVQDKVTAFNEEAPVFKQLDDYETHTLIDMRVDTEVEISRTSWDDYLDIPTETDYDYPSVVVNDLDTANYFAGFGPNDVLAVDGSGGFKADKADLEQLAKVGVTADNARNEWPAGDTNSEFYVGGIEDTYCHKLRVVKNGKPDTSRRPAEADNYCSQHDDPEELEQGIYWVEEDSLSDAIGMDVYAKGVGYFEDQATTEASPPGMVYVGDLTTGAWVTDANGNEYWDYNSSFVFLLPLIGDSTHHYRADYDAWNRDCRYPANKACYGSLNGVPLYGLHSPLVTSRFPGSAYVSSGLHDATLRGVGPAARGGGPGGGGK